MLYFLPEVVLYEQLMEFTSLYIVKFVIEKDQMYVENANRAMGEGDVFRIMVPLDETYSFDAGSVIQKNADKVPISADKMPKFYREAELTEQQIRILKYVQKFYTYLCRKDLRKSRKTDERISGVCFIIEKWNPLQAV